MLITGGRIIDPAQELDGLFDLRIRDGRITELGEHLTAEAGEDVLDAANCYVAPGFIDMHVHLREPGFEEKETIATGTAAAVAGGFTAVACMPNTKPAIDSAAVLRQIHEAAQKCNLARVHPVAAITKGREGRTAVDFTALSEAGAVAFSDDGNTVAHASVLWVAAIKALDVAARIISHCEDEDLKGEAVMTLGLTSNELGVLGAPSIAEDIIVVRDLLIAHDTGKPWHIAHLSTGNGIEFLRRARAGGVDVTVEVTPHHLYFSDQAVKELGPRAKVNPPLRHVDDARKLRDAVRDGTIDVFATDHAPHTEVEKSGDLQKAAVGFTGLEIAVGAYALALSDLPVKRFVELLSRNPARVLGLPVPSFRSGAIADVTIFADREWTVESRSFYSKGKATPFEGMKLPRRAVATIVSGEIKMRDGLVRT